MNHRKHFLLALSLSLVCGCSPKPAAPAEPATAPKQAAEAAVEKVASAGTNAKGAITPETPEAKLGNPSDIPASLKSDAFEYFGLGNDKSVDYEVRTEGQSEIGTGSAKNAFVGMKDGVAEFITTRTGALEQFGATDHVTSESDGVYTTSTSAGTLGGKHLELPVKLTPGSKWSATTTLTTPQGKSFRDDDQCVVKGTEHVQVPGGSYEALRVDSTGTAVIEGQKARTESRYWFVKGKGFVKFVSKIIPTKGKSLTITLTESKTGSSK